MLELAIREANRTGVVVPTSALYSIALWLTPEFTWSLERRAKSYHTHRDCERARKDFQTLHELGIESSSFIYDQFATLLSSGRITEAKGLMPKMREMFAPHTLEHCLNFLRVAETSGITPLFLRAAEDALAHGYLSQAVQLIAPKGLNTLVVTSENHAFCEYLTVCSLLRSLLPWDLSGIHTFSPVASSADISAIGQMMSEEKLKEESVELLVRQGSVRIPKRAPDGIALRNSIVAFVAYAERCHSAPNARENPKWASRASKLLKSALPRLGRSESADADLALCVYAGRVAKDVGHVKGVELCRARLKNLEAMSEIEPLLRRLAMKARIELS